MPPFPPSIVLALFSEPRRHVPNDEARVLRKRSERSRLRPRRRYELRRDESGWVTVSTIRLADGSVATT